MNYLNCLRHSRHRAVDRISLVTLLTIPKNLWPETWEVGHEVTKTKRQARQKVGHVALTPADDPNTFELVARNLKMKARGNQKSNGANQIKSSPHDTENHQKIIQNQPKIDGNRGLDWPWGLLGDAWEPFGLPRPSGTEKKKQMTKKWLRLGSHFGVNFRHFPWFFDVFLHSFSSLHFDGYQDRFFIDFDQFFRSFLEALFIIFQIVGK